MATFLLATKNREPDLFLIDAMKFGAIYLFAVGNRVTPVPPGRRGWSPTPDSHRT